MSDIFKIHTARGPVAVNDLTPQDWRDLESAANFKPCSGRRLDQVVSNELGHLWLIDTTGEAHAVDPMRFVAVNS